MANIQGLFFDGKTAAKTEASLNIEDDGTTCVSAYPKKRFKFSSLSISNRIGDSDRFITLPNGWLFESNQNDELDALILRFGAKDPVSAAREPWLTRLAILALFLLISWGLIHFGVPGLAKKVAFMVPTETLVNMGKSSLIQMDAQHFEDTKINTARQQDILKDFSKLLPEDNQGYQYKLHFRHAPEIGANAFALPSGDIIVTDDLIKLAENDKELRGILLHEIGHVEMRHGMQSTAQTSILALVVIAVSGDVSSASTLLAAIPALLLNAGYTRNMEWDADGYALKRIEQLNFDPEFFAGMMEKITESVGSDHSRYWSTHPHSDKRIERIRTHKKTIKSTSI